jgi:hypothetical protein
MMVFLTANQSRELRKLNASPDRRAATPAQAAARDAREACELRAGDELDACDFDYAPALPRDLDGCVDVDALSLSQGWSTL